MALTQIIQFSVNTVDVLMIARLGPSALAAAALGQVMYTTAFLFCLGPVMAISPMVSQALGANEQDFDGVRRSVRMGLWAIAILCPAVFVFFVATPFIANTLGQPTELGRAATPYVIALAPGWAAFMGVFVLRNFLAAIGQTRFPLYVIFAATVLNAALNYLLIFGAFGVPSLGILGAGIASSIANCFALIALSLFCYSNARARPFDLFADLGKPDWVKFKEVIRLGIPISITTAFEGLLFNGAVFLMGLIGIIEVAAVQVALNFGALIFMISLGFSMGGAVRVGLHAGAGDGIAARRASVLTILICVILVTPISIFSLFAPSLIAKAYLFLEPGERASSEMLLMTASFIRMVGIFMIFDAVQAAANQTLRGLKDVRAPMFITAMAYWGIGFSVAWSFGPAGVMGAEGVWLGLILALVASAAGLSIRLAWRTHKLIADQASYRHL
ncbi:MAG: MATE family efflux transporter [Pseudomonadota bacterium]